MAITAYIGVPGSGKSYEVVKSVIIPALIRGRRVVTNIYGLKIDDIYSYCKKKSKKSEIGSLISVSNDQCKDSEFLPYKDSSGTFCVAGDLVVLDEVWRFWEKDADIHANHRSFVAEHRHFADEKTKFTCDLVVINQAIVNIPRFIKDRIESTFRMNKLKSLGMTNRYRVDVFNGVKTFKNNLSTQSFSKYEKEIYSLYASHETEGAVEDNVDDRRNIFKNKFFIGGAVLMLVCFWLSISSLISLFSKGENKESIPVSNDANQEEKGRNPKSLPKFAPQHVKPPELSTKWRVKGSYKTKDGAFVILVSDSATRLEPMSNFSFSGSLISGVIDGELVTTYSGDNK